MTPWTCRGISTRTRPRHKRKAMLIHGTPTRTIWPAADGAVEIIDQTKLPHAVEVVRLTGLVNMLTHCNAGWLATVDWGTALSPVYVAQERGIEVHVWVDETRPRNQGAALTAFELGQQGIAHTVIADNAGGHLMQHGTVD